MLLHPRRTGGALARERSLFPLLALKQIAGVHLNAAALISVVKVQETCNKGTFAKCGFWVFFPLRNQQLEN